MRPDSHRSYLSVCENNGENVETQKLESGRHFGGSCLHGHAKTAPAHWSPRHNVPDIKCSPQSPPQSKNSATHRTLRPTVCIHSSFTDSLRWSQITYLLTHEPGLCTSRALSEIYLFIAGPRPLLTLGKQINRQPSIFSSVSNQSDSSRHTYSSSSSSSSSYTIWHYNSQLDWL